MRASLLNSPLGERDNDEGLKWGVEKVKPVSILFLHDKEIKELKERVGKLEVSFKRIEGKVDSLDVDQRKITAEMETSFSDVKSTIDTLKNQVAQMDSFHKSEIKKNLDLINELKQKGLTKLSELAKAIEEGDERINQKLSNESLSLMEKIELANKNIEVNKQSYDRLSSDLIKVSSIVTVHGESIKKLDQFVELHKKRHIEIDGKFKEQGDKLDSVYDEVADFQNTIENHEQRISDNFNNLNDYSADFSNHVEDYRSHVKSVNTHIDQFKEQQKAVKALKADYGNHLRVFKQHQADFKDHANDDRRHRKVYQAPKRIGIMVGLEPSRKEYEKLIKERRAKKGLSFLDKIFLRNL